MDTARNRYRGAAHASALAGPIFLAMLGVVVLSTNDQSWLIGWDAVWPVVATLALSIPVGAVLAFIPNFLGTAAMLRADEHLEAAHLPHLWTLVGGLTAGGAVATYSPLTASPMSLVFGLTGAISAFICWRGAQDR